MTAKKKPACTWRDCEQTEVEHKLVTIYRVFSSGNLAVRITTHFRNPGGEWWGTEDHVHYLRAHDRDAYRRARNYARSSAEKLGCPIVDQYGAFGLNMMTAI